MIGSHRTRSVLVPGLWAGALMVLALLAWAEAASAATPTPTPAPQLVPVNPGVDTLVDASASTKAQVRVLFPAQTFAESRLAAVQDAEVRTLPTPLPPGVREALSPFRISVYQSDGSPLERPDLGRCITVTTAIIPEDAAAAEGRLAALVLMRYDSAVEAWIPLTTRVDVVAYALSAQVCASLSTFAIGVQLPPGPPTPVPPTPIARLPVPGDPSPPAHLPGVVLAAGVLLLAAGGLSLRRAGRAEQSPGPRG